MATANSTDPRREAARDGQDHRLAISGMDEVRAWQRQLLQGVLRAIAIVALVAVVIATYDSVGRGQFWTVPFYWISYAIVLVLVFWRNAPYSLGAGAIMIVIYVQGFVDFIQDGLAGSARIFMLTFVFVAALFLGRRASFLAMAMAILTMAGMGAAFSAGWLTVPGVTGAGEPELWIVATFTFLLLALLMIVSLNFLMPRLAEALGQSRHLAQELEAERAQLEVQVEERTADLARRTVQLETAAKVARDAGVVRDVEQLLAETARLISIRFGFYHTGIFLLDDQREYAVLRAASSSGGQRMMARGHKLQAGAFPVGIVGQVATGGGAHIALDVGTDAVFFDNPDLPETRSEIALPLQARGERIGVLDVQSTEPDAFSQEDVEVLQTLADLVAVAISNAQLYQRTQASLEAERRAYGEMSAKAWREMARLGGGLQRRYDPRGILPAASGARREAMRRAIIEAKPVLAAGEEDVTSPTVAIPIKVRGQVIGVIDAHKPATGGEWTEEEQALLETLTDQLGVALDSARLYQETERRAAQERLVGEVTARMRQTLDVDAVLDTAVDEIAKVMGVAALDLRLGLAINADPPTEVE